MTLVKAQLCAQDGGEKAQLCAQDGGETIDFMFNPTELTFSRSLNLNTDSGARTNSGLPKVSFAYPQPYSLRISNILFDTRESQTSVLPYIDKFKQAVAFSEFRDVPQEGGRSRSRPPQRSAQQGPQKRPPTYLFSWREAYLHCFVKSLTYKLTLFMPDGTPIRAVVDIELEEVDTSEDSANPPAERSASDTPDARTQPPERATPTGSGLAAAQQQGAAESPASDSPAAPESPTAEAPATPEPAVAAPEAPATDAMDALGEELAEAAEQATEAVSQAVDDLANTAESVLNQATQLAEDVAGQTIQAAEEVLDQAKQATEEAIDQLTTAAAAATQATSEAVNQATEAASQAASQATEAASEATNQATEAASEAASQATEAASEAASQATEAASEAANQVTEAASQASDAATQAADQGSNSMDSLDNDPALS